MDYTKLINYINAKRDELGWSINELGRHCPNLSASQIANVLGGRSAPGLEFFVQVARALNASPVDLLELAGIVPRQKPAGDPLFQRWCALYSRLSPEQRQVLLELLEKASR